MSSTTNSYVFQNSFTSFDVDSSNLPIIIDNGLHQSIPIRSNINYNIDSYLNFYCLNIDNNEINDNNNNHFSNSNRLSLLNVKVILSNSITLFDKKLPIICTKSMDKFNFDNDYNYQKNFNYLKNFKKIFINSIFIDSDLSNIKVNSINSNSIDFILTPISDNNNNKKILLFDDNDSKLITRMEFKQDIRNLMLKWKYLTYFIGSFIFFIISSLIFIISAIITFTTLFNYSSSSNENNNNFKTKLN